MLAQRLLATRAASAASGSRSVAARGMSSWLPSLRASLEASDPELADIFELEKQRQKNTINLIASENFTSVAVMDALGSHMSNKYSEGYPGARYYGGNQHIDKAELLCQARASRPSTSTLRMGRQRPVALWLACQLPGVHGAA